MQKKKKMLPWNLIFFNIDSSGRPWECKKCVTWEGFSGNSSFHYYFSVAVFRVSHNCWCNGNTAGDFQSSTAWFCITFTTMSNLCCWSSYCPCLWAELWQDDLNDLETLVQHTYNQQNSLRPGHWTPWTNFFCCEVIFESTSVAPNWDQNLELVLTLRSKLFIYFVYFFLSNTILVVINRWRIKKLLYKHN